MGDVVQNLFWHFGEYAKKIKCEAVSKYRDGNLSPAERRGRGEESKCPCLSPSGGTEISWWGIGPFEAPKLFLSLFSGQSSSDPTTNLKSTADVRPRRVSSSMWSLQVKLETIAIVAKYRSFQLLVLKLQKLGHLHQLSHSDLNKIKHIGFFHKICFASLLIYAISITFPSQLLSRNSRRTPNM